MAGAARAPSSSSRVRRARRLQGSPAPGGCMGLEALAGGLRRRSAAATRRRRSAAAAEAHAAALGLPMATAWAQRAAAAVALHAGEPGAAAERALASAAAAEEVGRRDRGGAVAHGARGRALAAAGDGSAAVAQLEHAAATFERLRALPHRDAAEQRAARARPHRPPPHAARARPTRRARSLTERELQIARLVVDRRTNPEIAGELFLSPKTVETHLRNMFRKVGVVARGARPGGRAGRSPELSGPRTGFGRSQRRRRDRAFATVDARGMTVAGTMRWRSGGSLARPASISRSTASRPICSGLRPRAVSGGRARGWRR